MYNPDSPLCAEFAPVDVWALGAEAATAALADDVGSFLRGSFGDLSPQSYLCGDMSSFDDDMYECALLLSAK